MQNDSPNLTKNMNIDILAFGAHPDDVECAAGGVVSSITSTGGTVVIVDLTKGEMGSFGDEFTRKIESEQASEILGIMQRLQLNLGDANIENNLKNRLEVITLIRHYRPKVVLANAIQDRHPDHKKAAELVAQASYLSGLKKIETVFEHNAQEAWRPQAVYHYIQDKFLLPNVVVDISPYFEKKMTAVKAYQSQFIGADDHQPNGSVNLLTQIESTNRIFGRSINVDYAEGFTSERYIGVRNISDLI